MLPSRLPHEIAVLLSNFSNATLIRSNNLINIRLSLNFSSIAVPSHQCLIHLDSCPKDLIQCCTLKLLI